MAIGLVLTFYFFPGECQLPQHHLSISDVCAQTELNAPLPESANGGEIVHWSVCQ